MTLSRGARTLSVSDLASGSAWYVVGRNPADPDNFAILGEARTEAEARRLKRKLRRQGIEWPVVKVERVTSHV